MGEKHEIIGVSLSEPHTSESMVRRPTYKNFLHENGKPHTDATCIAFTKIFCTKMESPTLVAEWYVRTFTKISCIKTEALMPHASTWLAIGL